MAAGIVAQGEIYWVDRGEPYASEDGFRRPYVVIQNDRANGSAIKTVLACPLTTNMRRAAAPGNVVVEPGQSGLPQRSVVNVSMVASVDRYRFENRAGRVSKSQLREIMAGLVQLIDPDL